ncbi:mitochondrial inner membrane protein [Lichtheimia corymbifera JMRC:FSU:9682]|uniref:Succinate dehydrogenase [ubiquinone] cytochrome b small subunit n=1 Tax=Lichtheimia corymbifera JMRC:FSU:9682 TaxID=1263082 RepID=A0A068RNL2_9FUNG|nr:mitochondrial inner membrane protein [Lichtheimia corymbifera JMRC:FSU:9682]
MQPILRLRTPLYRIQPWMRSYSTHHSPASVGKDATRAIVNPLNKHLDHMKDKGDGDSKDKGPSTTTTTTTEKEASTTEEGEQGYQYGTYHWTLERVSAVALIPLITTQFVYGAQPICDGLLGVVLPFHIHLGFDSCITDYLPKREYPRLHKAAMWTLRGSTALVMWGCYEINTNEVGLTEIVQRLWLA